MTKINQEAISFIGNLIEDECSDIECAKIAQGVEGLKNIYGDDWTWKKRRVQVLEHIQNILMEVEEEK